jgi:hypothetical protein
LVNPFSRHMGTTLLKEGRTQTRHFDASPTRLELPTSIYVKWVSDLALSIHECGLHPHKSVGRSVDAP